MKIGTLQVRLLRPLDTNYHGPKSETLKRTWLFVWVKTGQKLKKGFHLWFYEKSGKAHCLGVYWNPEGWWKV